jgi:Protein of unknown function (DUF3306)
MEAESFFSRWEKRNAEKRETEVAPPAPVQPAVEDPPRPTPTLEEVAQLTHDSDFKPFVARGVDENVRRSAMKKLFSDPQFNVMDGLDVYIEDYNKFVPMPAHVLAALNHAQALLDPLKQLQHPVMRLVDTLTADAEAEGKESEGEQVQGQEQEQEQDRGQEQEPPQAGDSDRQDTPAHTEGQQDNDHQV